MMKNNGLSGERIILECQTGYIWSDSYGEISQNGIHYAIRIGDMIYDNMNVKGIKFDDWLLDLGVSEMPSMFKIITQQIN